MLAPSCSQSPLVDTLSARQLQRPTESLSPAPSADTEDDSPGVATSSRLTKTVLPPPPRTTISFANKVTAHVLEGLSTQLLLRVQTRQFTHPIIRQYCSSEMECISHLFGRRHGIEGFLNTWDICFECNSKFTFEVSNSCVGVEEDDPRATVWLTLRVANLPYLHLPPNKMEDITQEIVVKLDWMLESEKGWLCHRASMIRGGPIFASKH
jgi:hypothetical protein